MTPLRSCVDCGRAYDPSDPRKAGKISQCDACGRAAGEVSRVKGYMIADSKCSSSIQIGPAEEIDELRRVARIGSVVTH